MERSVDSKQENFETAFRLVRLCLDVHDIPRLRRLLEKLHIADLADIFEDLPPHLRDEFLEWGQNWVDAELLLNIHESYRQQVIEVLGFEHFRSSLPELSNEDIFTLIEDFDELTQTSLLSLLSPARARSVRLFLNYPESSVGRYMSVDFLQCPDTATVQSVLNLIEGTQNLPENFAEIFVVDATQTPVGVVFLKDLVNAPLEASIEPYIDRDIHPISTAASKEEASSLFSKYRSVRVPVVSPKGKVVGILRSDNVLDIVFDENSERILDVGGMPVDQPADSFWQGCFGRLRWIAVTVLNASLSPLIIQAFSGVIEKVICLASLMPLVASIGGVVGIQSVSIMIKEFAEGHRPSQRFGQSIVREVAMGFVNGLVIGVVIGLVAALWLGDMKVGVVLCLAMFASMTWAAFVGTALPILSAKLGFDSSLCSGPIVTTLTDVSGFALFLSLAKLILI